MHVFNVINLELEFPGKRVCPEESCKAHFKYKDGFRSHLMNSHHYGLEEAQAEVEGEERPKVKDRLEEPVRCTICGSKWVRKSLLLRHLQAVHNIAHSEATRKTMLILSGGEENCGNENMEDVVDDNVLEEGVHEDVLEEGVQEEVLENRAGDSFNDLVSDDVIEDMSQHEDEEDEENAIALEMLAMQKKMRALGRKKNELAEKKKKEEKGSNRPLKKWKVKGSTKRSVKKDIREVSKCPVAGCDRGFKSAFNTKRHIMDFHGVDKDELKKYDIKNVHSRCQFCKEFFANVQKHEKVCKLKREKKTTIESEQDIPEAFLPGGGLLLEEWQEWIQTSGLAQNTIGLYSRKICNIFKFWERTVDAFLVDSLILPLENSVIFPSLNEYLAQAEPTDQKVAIQAYQKLCDMVTNMFDKRYGANRDFTLVEKTAFTTGILNARKAQSVKLKNLNKQISINTQKKAAEKAADPEELLHNHKKMKEILVRTLRNPELKSFQNDLLTLTPKQYKEKHDKETTVNFLKSHILMEGKRMKDVISCSWIMQKESLNQFGYNITTYLKSTLLISTLNLCLFCPISCHIIQST